MRRSIAAIALLALALLLSACCGPLLSGSGRTGTPSPVAGSIEEKVTPCPTCEPGASMGGIELTPPDSPQGLMSTEDEAAFLEDLAEALEGEGWTIANMTEDYISIQNPVSELKTILLYRYEAPTFSRIVVQAIFMGQGVDTNLSCEALEAYNLVNDNYNIGKISADPDGDIWFETVYTFSQALDPAVFSEYLNWLDETLFYMVDEIEDYTS